jgi:exodeoxyribonuclease VII large subunit
MRLDQALRDATSQAVDGLRGAAHRLERQHPLGRLALESQRIGNLRRRLDVARERDQAARASRARELGRALAAVSPLATLARGFVIVRRPGGAVVTSAVEVKPGERLDGQWADGSRPLRVEGD